MKRKNSKTWKVKKKKFFSEKNTIAAYFSNKGLRERTLSMSEDGWRFLHGLRNLFNKN